MKARCAVCDKFECEHLKNSAPASVYEDTVVSKPAVIPEPEVKYVPGTRSTETVSIGSGKERVVTREVIGQRGERGFTGERGPEGKPGKDANISVAIAAGQQAARVEFNRLKTELSIAIVAELKAAGVIDQLGRAILKEGKPGLPSTVPGPKGDPGDTQAAIDAGKIAAREARTRPSQEQRERLGQAPIPFRQPRFCCDPRHSHCGLERLRCAQLRSTQKTRRNP